MLPVFNESCFSDPGLYYLHVINISLLLNIKLNLVCEEQGCSVLVIACQATLGDWEDAWSSANLLPLSVYDAAGEQLSSLLLFIYAALNSLFVRR